MKYVGSKNRISKEILPIIQGYINDNNINTYFEPFVGGANMIDKVKCRKRIGNDIHTELIELLKEIQKEDIELPKTITEEEYNNVRLNKENYPKWYVGFIGFCSTFGAKYFGGYARGFKADKITPRDIPNEAIRNLEKQIPLIKDVIFTNKSYLDFDKDKIHNCVIYCDPPYKGTTEYKNGGFDHESFWDWVRELSENNKVFVSEYNAPNDFECIWEKKVTTSLKVKEHENRIERLYTYKN